MKHPRSGVCQSGGVSLCCLQNLSLFIPFNELSGILPALAVHRFQCLLVFRQGRHALGAVRRNDTHDALLFQLEGAAHGLIVPLCPQEKPFAAAG